MKKILFPILSVLLLCVTSCVQVETPTLGDITVDNIAPNSFTCSVVVDAGDIADCGFYYGTSKLNVTNNKGSKVQATLEAGSFSAVITGLTPNTTYYIKGYAMNEAGEAVTAIVDVKTSSNVPNADDNKYPEVSK